MEIIRSREFKASRAWGAKDIANMNGITTRLHWTDQPYKWHINDGEEVFVVLDGVVEMLYRIDGQEKTRAFRILCQLILAKYLRRHPSDLQNESPVETMSYSNSVLALSIS